MEISWQSEIYACMKEYGISRNDLAEQLGYTPEYISVVLGKKRLPKDAEQKFRSALKQLVTKKRAMEDHRL